MRERERAADCPSKKTSSRLGRKNVFFFTISSSLSLVFFFTKQQKNQLVPISLSSLYRLLSSIPIFLYSVNYKPHTPSPKIPSGRNSFFLSLLASMHSIAQHSTAESFL